MKPLINEEFEILKWDEHFKDYKLLRLRVPTDGSCYFHALAKAYFKPYITGKIDDETFDRKSFIRNLRKDLAKKLGSNIDPKDHRSKTYYDTLSNGELKKIAKSLPEYSLENMQKELSSSTTSISNIYNEFISNELNIDIYILDALKKDVYMTGTEDKLLYKNRKSIVILYMPGHYELVGYSPSQDYVETYFEPTHPFIKHIQNRMNQLRK